MAAVTNRVLRSLSATSNSWVTPAPIRSSAICSKQWPLLSSSTTYFHSFLPHVHQHTSSFSTESSTGYYAQKRAAKEQRTLAFREKVERKERVKTRRVGRKRGQNRVQFRHFFVKKKVQDEYMNRKARQKGMPWKIQVAVIVERFPLVVPDLEKWEIEYEELRAHLDQFGPLYPKGLFPHLERSNKDDPLDIDSSSFEDIDEDISDYLTEESQFPRETEADASGEVRTTDRKLKTSVYLTVQDQDKWQFPTVVLKEDETILQAAKRAVNEKVGSVHKEGSPTTLDFWCPSNAPWAVDMVAFPAEEQQTTGVYGTKTFFVKIQYDSGAVDSAGLTVQDYAWLDRFEIVDRIMEQQDFDASKFYYYML